MADKSKDAERVVYVKGDRVAVATTKAKAVAREFDGYVKSEAGAPEADVEDAPEGVNENANPDAPSTDDTDSGEPADANVPPSPSRVFGRP